MAGQNETAANPKRLGYVGRVPGARASDEWFTPPKYIEAVKAVLRGITLDPFSCDAANEIVQATYYMTPALSAFDHDWKVASSTKVFMNPPYSAGMCSKAVGRFMEMWLARSFCEGIVLVNNATDTRWFQQLLFESAAVCFTNHRIAFWNADGKQVSNNTRGQAFLYFGNWPGVFGCVFRAHGHILLPLMTPEAGADAETSK